MVTVFVAALATALATGLGALPMMFVRSAGRLVLGSSNAVASGVMLAACVTLSLEGADRSIGRTTLGVAGGIVFVLVTARYLDKDRGRTMGSLRGEDARRALLIVGVMTVHSAAEGIGIGAAFGGGATFGLVIAIAIAIHNIPEGLAISLVLVPRGTSVRAAAGWSIFSSLPQPLLAVPAFLFVDAFSSILPIGLGFAAGAMVWMVIGELLPEALAMAPYASSPPSAPAPSPSCSACRTCCRNAPGAELDRSGRTGGRVVSRSSIGETTDAAASSRRDDRTMSNRANRHGDGVPHVVIAGGGVAALEGVLALRAVAGEAVTVEVVATEQDFVVKALSVAAPFLADEVRRYPLGELVAAAGGTSGGRGYCRSTPLVMPSPPMMARCRTTHCCWPSEPSRSPLSRVHSPFVGPRRARACRPSRCTRDRIRTPTGIRSPPGPTRHCHSTSSRSRPGATSPTAALTSSSSRSSRRRARSCTVRPPGRVTSSANCWPTGTSSSSPPPRSRATAPANCSSSDNARSRQTTSSRWRGSRADIFPEYPATPRVRSRRRPLPRFETDDVYAAGDMTSFPVQHGGIATQQADAAIDAIAFTLGFPIDPAPSAPSCAVSY